jgi:hypothetical protein
MEERELIRRWVETWKEAGPVLEEIRRQEYRDVEVDSELATRIAIDYVSRLSVDSGTSLILLNERTIERNFGWAFFYGPSDPSMTLAGNAPFIVDRKDGSIHVTGTAYPTEQYLESYSRVGRTYPFAVPEYVVILDGWKPGMPGILKAPLTRLIRSATQNGLAGAKHCTDEVVDGKSVILSFSGASAKFETRFR